MPPRRIGFWIALSTKTMKFICSGASSEAPLCLPDPPL
jgi:hypothetical protein